MAKKFLIAGAAVILLAGGSTAFLLIPSSSAPAAEAAAPASSAAAMAPVYVALAPLNMPVFRDSRVAYHYYISASLQVTDEAAKQTVEQQMPRLRDAFLREVNSRPVLRGDGTETLDFAALKARLKRQCKAVLGAELVVDILITQAIRGG